MQVLLHADPNTDGSELMAEHLKTVVLAAMQRFGERVTRVEAHLSDVHSQARSSSDDIHCSLDAHLVGQDAVVVTDQAGNAHQAIEGAVRKLKRAVGSALGKHDPRSRRQTSVVPAQDPAADEPS